MRLRRRRVRFYRNNECAKLLPRLVAFIRAGRIIVLYYVFLSIIIIIIIILYCKFFLFFPTKNYGRYYNIILLSYSKFSCYVLE